MSNFADFRFSFKDLEKSMSESSKTQLSMDELDTTENSAASQGNISRELAHKIWRVTPSDISLGIPEPTVPTYPFIGGVDWGSGGSSSSKHPANDAATAFISEVERALYADSTGYPENGTPNYFKAAENYAIYGDNFLDFPKDTSTCFAGLGSTGRSTSNPPPGFERSARSSALYERRQTPSQAGSASTPNFSGFKTNARCSININNIGSSRSNSNSVTNTNTNPNPNPNPNHNHNPNSRISGSNINEIPFPQIYHQLFSQSPSQAQSSSSHHQHPNHSHNQQHSGASQSPQQQHHHQQHHQQRGGGGAASGGDHLGGHPPTNEISLSQLYQQLMARNLRTNHLHQHQQQQQQTNSNAAAAAMIYANLELQQQMQLRQLQLQQLHQQQQQHSRLPRGIYGGNNGQGTGGAVPPTGGKEPPTGNHK
ncbi:uncharacterized protein Dana_GF14721 [Drosophila ananassae]|uniref:Uncharacterized protein n=1 Tax=Drosophila ananassae TaxID=7217 RepID=B3MNL1_DROAN|nr:uncharacterized protein Dana_GF14721 [Drosophila ananassae]